MEIQKLDREFLGLVLNNDQHVKRIELHKRTSNRGCNAKGHQNHSRKPGNDHQDTSICKKDSSLHDQTQKEETEKNQYPVSPLEFTFTDLCAKPRLKWSPSLHLRFLQAVTDLGGPFKATPRYILEKMGIPGLTLRHVKSHLQKHRLGLNGNINGDSASSTEENPGEAASSGSSASVHKRKNISKTRKTVETSVFQRAIYRDRQMKYRMRRKLRKQQELMKVYLGSLAQTTNMFEKAEIYENEISWIHPSEGDASISSVPPSFGPTSAQDRLLPVNLPSDPMSFASTNYPSAPTTSWLNGPEAQPANMPCKKSAEANTNVAETWFLPDIANDIEGIRESSAALINDTTEYSFFEDNHLVFLPQERMAFSQNFPSHLVSCYPTKNAAVNTGFETETNNQTDDYLSTQNGCITYGASDYQQEDQNTYAAGDTKDTRNALGLEDVDSEIFYENWVANGGLEIVSAWLQE